jgi:hypothetical protein
MDDFFEEEELFEDDSPKFQAEAKAFERVSGGGKLYELLSSPNAIQDQEKKGREIISPEDRFLINTDALCRRMNSEGITRISESDINIILEKTTLIVNLRYKNYVAYILGYLASSGGKNMKVENVKNVIDRILPHVSEEGGVQPADVVRYARFWNGFL